MAPIDRRPGVESARWPVREWEATRITVCPRVPPIGEYIGTGTPAIATALKSSLAPSYVRPERISASQGLSGQNPVILLVTGFDNTNSDSALLMSNRPLHEPNQA
ncbi:hypothetical protein CRG98_020871 [Punica granatum]|uniref:Uncharacterized protein n=1 Tax=Punica granatum TaxID=22663 RepID=A0A2I0JR05_PUNGR|nr:hypothetical protein CRG98_020871 [Punica granatum]